MKNLFFLLLALVAGYFFFQFGADSTAVSSNTQEEQREETLSAPPAPVEQVAQSYIVEDGDVFASVIEKLGYEYADMLDILAAGEDIYDFTNVRVGKEFRKITKDAVFDRIEYDINLDDMAIIRYDDSTWGVEVVPIPYEVEVTDARGVITSSLFEAGQEMGLQDRTIIDLANVFAWEIDFATVIRQGDTFSILYEERKRGGEQAPSGPILAAVFINDGRRYEAVHYTDPEGNVSYYNREGESLIKQFLKSPLKYSRITSGFSYARFHPVVGSTFAHKAIDYAASYGTPVYATADGTILRSSWNGGFGNYIDIKHNDTWRTQYAHLSGYARGIRPGAHVEQGQIIGYVGSTGWSTGNHLHYQMMKYGQLVDPLRVELPSGEPIKEEWRESFDARKAEFAEFFSKM